MPNKRKDCTMTIVINRKEYNTDTADMLHEWSNHYFRDDYNFCSESLYRTAKGALFIHGKGGPKSKYAVNVGNSRTAGEDMYVVSEEEAIDWLEKRDGIDALRKYFSDRIEEA